LIYGLTKKNIRFNPRITILDLPIINKVENKSILFDELVEITQGLTLYRRSTLIEKYGAKKAEEIVTKRLFHCDYKKTLLLKKNYLDEMFLVIL
jgi:hypothetical protein